MKQCDSKKIFSEKGIKNTNQRNLIFNIINESKTPMTAESIYLELKKVDASISLSTVYRILDVFVDKGVAKKSNMLGENKSVFELNRLEHNHHLICLKCKKIIDIGECPLSKFEKDIENETEFDIVGHNYEIYGYCPECKKKKQD